MAYGQNAPSCDLLSLENRKQEGGNQNKVRTERSKKGGRKVKIKTIRWGNVNEYETDENEILEVVEANKLTKRPLGVANVDGQSCENEAKVASWEFFRKSLFKLNFFACWNVHTLEYIGVNLPPHSTKFAPTVDHWSWYHSYESYQRIHITVF